MQSVHQRDRARFGHDHTGAAGRRGVNIDDCVVQATHVGDDRIAGWNAAVLVSAALTVVGACDVVLAGKPARTPALTRATNGT